MTSKPKVIASLSVGSTGCDRFTTDLMHGVGEEGLEGAPLARRLLLQTVEEVGKLGVLLALRQDLQKCVVDIQPRSVNRDRSRPWSY